jgi:hypothetical protein
MKLADYFPTALFAAGQKKTGPCRDLFFYRCF